MTNPYYTPGSVGAAHTTARVRPVTTEFTKIGQAFDRLHESLNDWATATSATSMTIGTGSKNFVIEGGHFIQVGQFLLVASAVNPSDYMIGQVTDWDVDTGNVTVNFTSIGPGASGTYAAWTVAIALSDGGNYLTPAGAAVLTNKEIDFGANTVSMTLAQLNTALTDADVATLAGAETFINKSISFANNTMTMTLAQLNTALSDADVATLAGVETMPNKTFPSPVMSNPTINGAAKEQEYTVTDSGSVVLNPKNGGIQFWTLGANRTPSFSWDDGESMTLHIADGTAFTVNLSSGGAVPVGGTSPILPTTGWGVFEMWKAGGTIRYSYTGPVA